MSYTICECPQVTFQDNSYTFHTKQNNPDSRGIEPGRICYIVFTDTQKYSTRNYNSFLQLLNLLLKIYTLLVIIVLYILVNHNHIALVHLQFIRKTFVFLYCCSIFIWMGNQIFCFGTQDVTPSCVTFLNNNRFFCECEQNFEHFLHFQY